MVINRCSMGRHRFAARCGDQAHNRSIGFHAIKVSRFSLQRTVKEPAHLSSDGLRTNHGLHLVNSFAKAILDKFY